MIYEITGSKGGNDNILICSTRAFNKALDAKRWAILNGFGNVTLHTFNF